MKYLKDLWELAFTLVLGLAFCLAMVTVFAAVAANIEAMFIVLMNVLALGILGLVFLLVGFAIRDLIHDR